MIQASTVPESALVERFETTEQTVYKWKHRDSVHDCSHTPHRLQATRTPPQKEVAVVLHKTLLVFNNDLLAAQTKPHRQARVRPNSAPNSEFTDGMIERFNGRFEEVLQSHHFHHGEDLETTLHRYVALYYQRLQQSALGSKTPLQAMKDWHKLKQELVRMQPYHLPGCDM